MLVTVIDLKAALQHFSVTDPVLFQLAKNTYNPALSLPVKKQAKFYAAEIFGSIVSQQLSVKAAAAIWGRFLELVGETADPEKIKTFDIEKLKSVGLSRQKADYILAIAHGVTDGTVKLEHLDELDDEAVISELTQLRGVGRWTAEMFLIFTLARQDVFAVGDLGLQNAVNHLYEKEYALTELLELSQAWSPHRTVASLLLWHSLDNKPLNT